MPLNKATKSTNAGVSAIILYVYCILQNSQIFYLFIWYSFFFFFFFFFCDSWQCFFFSCIFELLHLSLKIYHSCLCHLSVLWNYFYSVNLFYLFFFFKFFYFILFFYMCVQIFLTKSIYFLKQIFINLFESISIAMYFFHLIFVAFRLTFFDFTLFMS